MKIPTVRGTGEIAPFTNKVSKRSLTMVTTIEINQTQNYIRKNLQKISFQKFTGGACVYYFFLWAKATVHSLNPFWVHLQTTLRWDMRSMPVIFLQMAFSDQL